MTGTIRRVGNFYLFKNDSSNPPTYYIDNGLDVSDDFGLQEKDRLMELSDKEFISECIAAPQIKKNKYESITTLRIRN